MFHPDKAGILSDYQCLPLITSETFTTLPAKIKS